MLLRKSTLADVARVTGKTSLAFILLCLTATFSPREGAMAENQATASAKRPEILRSFPLTKFYDTPDPLPPGKPGELIRSTEFEGYNLPLGVSAVRLLYHSRSANYNDVAVSAVA